MLTRGQQDMWDGTIRAVVHARSGVREGWTGASRSGGPSVHLLACALVLGTTFWQAPCVAQQDPGEETEAEGSEAEAREHFEIGRRYYDLGQFREAAAEFEEAYRLSNRPELLMNIYLSYRDAADPAAAALALGRYLETRPADDPERSRLEARLRALERQAEESEVVIEVTEPAGERRGTDLVGPVVLLATGGALVLAGVGTGSATVVEHGALEEACPDQICPAAEASRIDTVRALGITTDVLLGVGVAAAAAGAVWLIVGLTSGGEEEQTAALTCQGTGCSIRGTF